MPYEIDPERVRVIAAAAQIPLRPDAATRIARAVAPTATRFGDAKLSIPLEIEPATFVVVQCGEIDR